MSDTIQTIIQAGALGLLAVLLWVIFKELVPKFLGQMEARDQFRHQEHKEFLAALDRMRDAHTAQEERHQAQYITEMRLFRETLNTLSNRIQGCQFNTSPKKDKPCEGC